MGSGYTNKDGKARRTIFVLRDHFPWQIAVPESAVSAVAKQPGSPVRLKGEFADDGRFTLFCLQERPDGRLWDQLTEQIGVVDHVNHEKKTIHYLLNQQVQGIISFSDLTETFLPGQAIALRVAKQQTKNQLRYSCATAAATTAPAPDSLVLHFNEAPVSVFNGIGFARNCAVFIPPNLISEYQLQNDARISGLAVLSFNRKRAEWGWRAVIIEQVL